MAEVFIVEEMVEGSPCTEQKLSAARGGGMGEIDSICDPSIQYQGHICTRFCSPEV